MVYPNSNETLLSAYDRYRSMADGHVQCDYALSVWVAGWQSGTANEIAMLAKEKGISTF
jgi:hypothetical protein